ncbi:hypothetical protein PAXRUDRAFT_37245, partial [Paxillus rubicundulus Ve08.2h10]
AYTFTNYKSQGQTIVHVIVGIGKATCFSLMPFNTTYVALSRSQGCTSVQLLQDFKH